MTRGPYHPRTAGRSAGPAQLRTKDATAMAVGGMIGGGIFSVLGVAVTLAGHLAFGCFVLGGALAMVTARSWAGVTARAGRSGGPFDHLREQGHSELAGALLWLLVFGYMVASTTPPTRSARPPGSRGSAPSPWSRCSSR